MAKVDSIHQLVKRNNKNAVVKLLESKKEVINKRDSLEQTPLHIAAFEGFVDMVVTLLLNGANASSIDKNKWTPLHCAASSGQLQIVEILLDQGADVAALNNEGSAALHYMVRLNIPKADKPLFRRVIELMLEKKLDVNLQNLHGETPLHQACFRGRKPCVKILLKYMANPNLRTKFGETGLHFAARKGDLQIVQLLLAAGADPNIKGDLGTPRDVAAACHHKGVVELFASLPPVAAPLKTVPPRAAQPKSPQLPRPPPTLGTLPAELLRHVFSFLAPEDVARLARVSGSWRVVAKDGAVWKKFYTVRVARVRTRDKDSVKDWRRAFIAATHWQALKTTPRATLQGHSGKLQGLQFDEKAGKLVSAATDLKVWDLATAQCVTTIARGGPYTSLQVDETRIVCSSEDKTVKVWDLRSGQIVRTLLGMEARVQAVQADELRVVAASIDGRLLVWDGASGALQQTMMVERGLAVKSFQFEKDRLAVGVAKKVGGQQSVQLWSLRTGALGRSIPELYAGSLTFTRDWLAAAKDNRVKVWDLKSGHCLKTLRALPKSNVTCLQCRGDVVLAGEESGTVRVWDLQTGSLWKALPAHKERVSGLQFSDRLLATASHDGLVKLWDS